MLNDLILGTAGHIDHGKTTLIKCLTGVDTDRLPEEKRRGITIELGFAALDRLTMKIEKSLAESAAILNADAPRKIDAYTDFIGARTNGKEITYLFRKYGITPASLTA